MLFRRFALAAVQGYWNIPDDMLHSPKLTWKRKTALQGLPSPDKGTIPASVLVLGLGVSKQYRGTGGILAEESGLG